MGTELLQEYAGQVARLLARKNDLEFELGQVQQELDKLQDNLLPDEMLVNQLTKTTLESGVQITLNKDFKGGISYESGAAAARVLQQNGYLFNWAANIKIPNEKINIMAGKLSQVLIKNDLPPAQIKPDIHHSTFKKICRELDAKGVFDEETQQTLGVITQFSASVKLPE